MAIENLPLARINPVCRSQQKSRSLSANLGTGMKQLEHFDSPHPNPLHQEREPVVEVISYPFLKEKRRLDGLFNPSTRLMLRCNTWIKIF